MIEIYDSLAVSTVNSAQRAATTCNQSSITKAASVANRVNVKTALVDTDHHTTMRHAKSYHTIAIENIPISMVTFGLHLCSPWYNTSQRSGRYCTAMFNNTDEASMLEHVKSSIGDELTDVQYDNVLNWMMSGYDIFNTNVSEVSALAEESITAERPHFQKDIKSHAYKIAQEQLRNFISTIVPTGLLYTINDVALISMYCAAWNRPLKRLLKHMIDKIVDPEILGMFSSITSKYEDMMEPWCPDIKGTVSVVTEPRVRVLSTPSIDIMSTVIKYQKLHGVIDLLHFTPTCDPVNANSWTVKSELDLSVASFGQEQRHVTMKRSMPNITGGFYTPPLVAHLHEEASRYMLEYLQLCSDIGVDKMIHFIPYGAVVRYIREADPRAWYHAQCKRRCFNAQEEISRSATMEIQQLDKSIGSLVHEPCVLGKCPEGSRYCGRDLVNKVGRKYI